MTVKSLGHRPGRRTWPSTLPEVEHDQTKTMDVVAAGKKYFNLGRNASYDAAKRGDLPVIRIGGKIVALIPAIERMLEQGGGVKRDSAT
jgi:hypothetical protein